MPGLFPLSTIALLLAAAICALAAVAHFACIVIGPRAYRVMGAGTQVTQALARGAYGPHMAAAAVGVALLGLSAYALAATGALPAPPLMREVLTAAAVALLARACLFPWLMSRFAGNSMRFWFISSLVFLVLGGLFLVGAWPLWFSKNHVIH